MNKTLTILLLALGFESICFAQTNNPIIKNVRLFDGDNVYERVTITTKNGIITEISPNSEIEEYSENIIDGSGYTLVPGLINAHFHTRTKKT